MKSHGQIPGNERSIYEVRINFTLVLILVIAALGQSSSELSGYVRYGNNSPVSGAILSIGNFSVATDKNGYYRISYLTPGPKTVAVTPPNRETRRFPVVVNSGATQRDFKVDW